MVAQRLAKQVAAAYWCKQARSFTPMHELMYWHPPSGGLSAANGASAWVNNLTRIGGEWRLFALCLAQLSKNWLARALWVASNFLRQTGPAHRRTDGDPADCDCLVMLKYNCWCWRAGAAIIDRVGVREKAHRMRGTTAWHQVGSVGE